MDAAQFTTGLASPRGARRSDVVRVAGGAAGTYHRVVTDGELVGGRRLGGPAAVAFRFFVPLALFAFLATRLVYIARGELSGDEAIFGLMALEIGKGISYPLYCWGAHYASALVSYVAAPLIALFGPTPFSLRLAVLPWGMAHVLLAAFLFRRRFGPVEGLLAAFAIAFPLPWTLTFSVMAHGGYPETFFLGTAILGCGLALAESPSRARGAALGFLCGLSFAILWLGVPFLLAALALVVQRRCLDRTTFPALAGGFLVGSLPVWIYNLWIAPGSTFLRLGARSMEARPGDSVIAAALGRIEGIPRWFAESADGLHGLFAPVGGLPVFAVLLAFTILGALRLVRRGRPEGMMILAFLVGLLAFNVLGNLTRIRHWTTIWFILPWGLLGLDRRLGLFLLAALVVACGILAPGWVTNAWSDPRPRQIAELVRQTGADAIIGDYDYAYAAAYRMGGLVPSSAVAPPNPAERRPDWTESIRYHARRPAVFLPRAIGDRVLATLVAQGHGSQAYALGDRVFIVTSAPGSLVLNLVTGASPPAVDTAAGRG